MKKVFMLLAILLACTCSMSAQTTESQYKQQIKERKEMLKFTEKVIQTKCTKQAKQDAKRDKKEGWKPMPGERDLVNQYDEKLRLEVQENQENGFPVYIVGRGSAESVNLQMAYDVAKARVVSDIAQRFKVEFDQVIDESSNNTQTDEEIHMLHKFVSESTQYVSQNLRNIRPVVKMYRDRSNGKCEVTVLSYINFDQAKDILFEKMELENKELRKKFDRMVEGRKK